MRLLLQTLERRHDGCSAGKSLVFLSFSGSRNPNFCVKVGILRETHIRQGFCCEINFQSGANPAHKILRIRVNPNFHAVVRFKLLGICP